MLESVNVIEAPPSKLVDVIFVIPLRSFEESEELVINLSNKPVIFVF